MLTLQAKAEGHRLMFEAFNKDANALSKFTMIEKGVIVELAHANAEALKGMNPKISVWNTGDSGKDGNTASSAISDLLRIVPPMVSTI